MPADRPSGTTRTTAPPPASSLTVAYGFGIEAAGAGAAGHMSGTIALGLILIWGVAGFWLIATATLRGERPR
jgi:hypothetical protein